MVNLRCAVLACMKHRRLDSCLHDKPWPGVERHHTPDAGSSQWFAPDANSGRGKGCGIW
ncbi:MAG: hypothetical protein HN380_28180 [Victivallales bacterium]|jgi:hypothetical protein|nr:hypothetical protein [Victivallales bacterium]